MPMPRLVVPGFIGCTVLSIWNAGYFKLKRFSVIICLPKNNTKWTQEMVRNQSFFIHEKWCLILNLIKQSDVFKLIFKSLFCHSRQYCIDLIKVKLDFKEKDHNLFWFCGHIKLFHSSRDNLGDKNRYIKWPSARRKSRLSSHVVRIHSDKGTNDQ